ncbi:MAG: hypothetical protein HYR51_05275 [Candidatus Rokubacteria bacterium]|nr:hypothetical protein [Candidatus Rokubacteria bacterium]
MQSVLGISAALVLLGTVPAAAQMMGGTGGMIGGPMGMMGRSMHGAAGGGRCAASAGEATSFERPWISFALQHATELGLAADQVKQLTALRDDFQKEAIRLTADIRSAEVDLRRLYSQRPLDLAAVEEKLRAIAGLETSLRVARLRTLDRGWALLTTDQQKKLDGHDRGMGRMHGASATRAAGPA